MAADGLAGSLGHGNLGEHQRIPGDDAWIIHHLAETDDEGPTHGLLHILRIDRGAGMLEARGARHAARHLNPHIQRQRGGFVVHQLDACEAQHVGNLVGVDEHAGGAVRGDRAGELGHREHAALDVHGAVAQPGYQEAVRSLDDAGRRTDGAARVGADVGDASLGNRDVSVRNNFAGIDVDPTTLPDHQVGRRATSCDIDQAGCCFGPGLDSGHGSSRVMNSARCCRQSDHGRQWEARLAPGVGQSRARREGECPSQRLKRVDTSAPATDN